MSYTLSSLDEGHILIFTMNNDFNLSVDPPAYLQEAYERVENGPDRVVIITDATPMRNLNINDLVQAANGIHNPAAKRLNDHPKVIKNLRVINNKVLLLAAKGMNSAAFGFYEMSIFQSLEDALGHARMLLSSRE